MKDRAQRSVICALLLAMASLSNEVPAQSAPAVEAAYTAILAHPKVIKTLEDIKADDDRALAEQKRRWTRISGR
jgi:tripeptide aminopeptidase